MTVFISYRREDSEDVTGRIYEHLTSRTGDQSVFKDVDSIPFGADFRNAINSALDDCNVVLAIIGPSWLAAEDGTGHRRIDNTSDFVRVEIETALEKSIPVIPVLVRGASIPSPDQLPQSLQRLSDLNAAKVRADPDFTIDVARLQAQLSMPTATVDDKASTDTKEHLPNRSTALRPLWELIDLPLGCLATSSIALFCVTFMMQEVWVWLTDSMQAVGAAESGQDAPPTPKDFGMQFWVAFTVLVGCGFLSALILRRHSAKNKADA